MIKLDKSDSDAVYEYRGLVYFIFYAVILGFLAISALTQYFTFYVSFWIAGIDNQYLLDYQIAYMVFWLMSFGSYAIASLGLVDLLNENQHYPVENLPKDIEKFLGSFNIVRNITGPIILSSLAWTLSGIDMNIRQYSIVAGVLIIQSMIGLLWGTYRREKRESKV
jgi:hypothetical protein